MSHAEILNSCDYLGLVDVRPPELSRKVSRQQRRQTQLCRPIDAWRKRQRMSDRKWSTDVRFRVQDRFNFGNHLPESFVTDVVSPS